MVTRMQYHVTGHPGLPGLSTLHFIGESDAVLAETINGRIEQAWTDMAPSIRAGVTISGTGVATILDDATGNVIAQHAVTTWDVLGSNGADPMPLGTQGLALLRTGVYVGGREVRGRMYIPSPTQTSDNGEGIPNSTYSAGIVADIDTNLWAPPDGPLAVWSDTYKTIRPLSAIQMSNHWARLSTRQR